MIRVRYFGNNYDVSAEHAARIGIAEGARITAGQHILLVEHGATIVRAPVAPAPRRWWWK